MNDKSQPTSRSNYLSSLTDLAVKGQSPAARTTGGRVISIREHLEQAESWKAMQKDTQAKLISDVFLKHRLNYATVGYLSDHAALADISVQDVLNTDTRFRKSFIRTSDGESVYCLNGAFALIKDAWRSFGHLNALIFKNGL